MRVPYFCPKRRFNSSSELPLELSFSLNTAKADASTSAVKPVPLLILHGLFGSKQNWRSLSKSMSVRFGADVYSLDLRNHGESPHSSTMSIQSMSSDVSAFIKKHNLPKVNVIGHSMGGKIAMYLAVTEPTIQRAVIVDMAPLTTKPVGSMFQHYINSMRRVQLAKPQTTSDADAILKKDIPELSIRQFIITNLKQRKDSGEFYFRNNLDGIEKELHRLWTFPTLEKCDKLMLFIAGTKADYITRDMYPTIREQFSNAHFHEIDAGHWVHAEKPEEFVDIISKFLYC